MLWLVSARTQICVLTVCQQQRWQVLEHCANSRIRAGGGTKSVLTADLGVPPLERRPCVQVLVRLEQQLERVLVELVLVLVLVLVLLLRRLSPRPATAVARLRRCCPIAPPRRAFERE